MPGPALKTVSLITAALMLLTACSPGTADEEATTLKVVYQKTDSFTALETMFQAAKQEFEEANEGVTVQLEPIQANDDDYGLKLALALRSPATAPDVFYEDSFKVRSDVDAGYLYRLDSHLDGWADWEKYNQGAKAAGRADDGGTYAVPLGTDTRVIWYNRKVFEAAGISLPWEPRSWQDILATARAIKASNPAVTPFNMYAGKGTGEASVMQGFYELLYGTGSSLYDEESKKWVVGSPGFVDSLAFLQTLYEEELAVAPAEALDPNVWKKVFGEWFPNAELGATVEGSYAPTFWQEGGSYEWPEYGQDMAVTPFPTQDGSAPGAVSMSGGWTLAIGAETSDPDLAFKFLTTVMNRENSLAFTLDSSQIAVRSDVADDPAYQASNPFVKDVSDVVSISRYRPTTSDYPRISAAVQEATESVITGSKSPEQAAADYDAAVTDIVGGDNTVQK